MIVQALRVLGTVPTFFGTGYDSPLILIVRVTYQWIDSDEFDSDEPLLRTLVHPASEVTPGAQHEQKLSPIDEGVVVFGSFEK